MDFADTIEEEAQLEYEMTVEAERKERRRKEQQARWGLLSRLIDIAERATKTLNSRFAASATRSASACDWKLANTHAPLPVIIAEPKLDNHFMAVLTCSYLLSTTGCRSLRTGPSKKADTVIGGVLRVNSGAPKISCVET